MSALLRVTISRGRSYSSYDTLHTYLYVHSFAEPSIYLSKINIDKKKERERLVGCNLITSELFFNLMLTAMHVHE